MDIMMPPVNEQAAPAPWLVRRERIDVARVICEAVARNPNASPDEVTAELRKREAEIPATLVALRMKKCKATTS